jgi:hypothetical protein
MIDKHLIRPDRARQVPSSFSWIDHRLVRLNYLNRCDCNALALYLFLVTVSDAQGLSYYSDAAICRRLKLDLLQLDPIRAQLQKADLIAYRKPLYQVLSLQEPANSSPAPTQERAGQAQSVAQILCRVLEGGAK